MIGHGIQMPENPIESQAKCKRQYAWEARLCPQDRAQTQFGKDSLLTAYYKLLALTVAIATVATDVDPWTLARIVTCFQPTRDARATGAHVRESLNIVNHYPKNG